MSFQMINACETPLADCAAEMLGGLHDECLGCIGEELGGGKSGVKKALETGPDSRGGRPIKRPRDPNEIESGREGEKQLSACHGCAIHGFHGTLPFPQVSGVSAVFGSFGRLDGEGRNSLGVQWE
jgi:hypothetical protein